MWVLSRRSRKVTCERTSRDLSDCRLGSAMAMVKMTMYSSSFIWDWRIS